MSYSVDYQNGGIDLTQWLDEYVTEFGQSIHMKKKKNLN